MTPAGRSIRDFGGLRQDTSYYFVHSYGANPLHDSNLYASVLYGGQNVCAVAGKENVQGVQFHPEKSAKAGLKVLKVFSPFSALTFGFHAGGQRLLAP